MKHFLNFSPTVKFRVGSSFMFRTVMFILYVVPVAVIFFLAYDYSHLDQLVTEIDSFGEQITEFHRQGMRQHKQERVDFQKLEMEEKKLYTYHRTLTGFSFSWSKLFQTLEQTVPAGVRIQQISIVPDSVLRIAILGEGRNLEAVTGLIKAFYRLERFSRPRLARHALVNEGQKMVQFSMQVDYLPEIEVEL